MSHKKTGLLFSHFHVSENEHYKFDILKYNIDYFKSLDNNFFIVLCGHGYTPPSFITEKIDKLYWEDNIDHKEIGVGHPKFCIKGYNILLKNNIKYSIKLRGTDTITEKNLCYDLMQKYPINITEQTCINKKIIGDLLMFGETKSMLDLWEISPWDYNISGLYNLYNNAELIANKNKCSLNSLFKFISPKKIGWYSLENNWDKLNKSLLGPLTEEHLWGIKNKYEYYGGF
tara:strand:- start:1885 stop:2574 length:690 start_codon:yes stop_codon:yes gene_type:complete